MLIRLVCMAIVIVKYSNSRPVVASDYAYALERFADSQLAAPYSTVRGIRRADGFHDESDNRLAGVPVEESCRSPRKTLKSRRPSRISCRPLILEHPSDGFAT